jgi:hypothetical protein
MFLLSRQFDASAGERNSTDIVRLLKAAAFGAEESKVLAAAFDTGWNVLPGSGSTLAANDKLQ